MRRLFGLAAASIAGACSITTSLDGLTGGGATDAGPVDASQDADAQADAEADADAGRWCEGQQDPALAFCTDFDTDPLLMGLDVLTKPDVAAGSSEADTTTFTSAPRSLRVEVPAVSVPNAEGYYRVARRFDVAFRQAEMSLDVKIDPGSSGASVVSPIAFSLYKSNYDEYTVWIGASGGYLGLYGNDYDGGSTSTQSPFARSLPIGEWVRLRLVATIDDSGVSRVDLFADPDPSPLVSGATLPYSATGASLTLTVGAHSYGPAGAWVVHLDDVKVVLK